MKRALIVVFVLLGFVVGMSAERLRGQAQPRMWADLLLDVSTDEIPKRVRVHVNLDHWEPGAETGRHSHPGPTVLVVLNGELQETLGDGGRRVLKAGQAFWRPARTDHNLKNADQRAARAVAVHLDPVP